MFLIHSSFFIILLLLALTYMLGLIRVSPSLKNITMAGCSMMLGMSIFFMAGLLGARQATSYSFNDGAVSGLGFFLWLMILVIMLSSEKKFQRENSFAVGIVIFYLTTYFMSDMFVRIFESGVIIVLLAGLALESWRRQLFLGMVLGAGYLNWILRIGQPALGFAPS
jgi:hypothetical protein